MNYIDMNTDNKDSIAMDNFGTETSATSPFNPPQINGGWSFLGNNNNQKALQACKMEEFAALSFLIRNDMVSDYSLQDSESGSTILHSVVHDANNIPSFKEVITKILTNEYVPTFINLQDKDGNTPLHIALYSSNQMLCDLLIKAGANPKLRNNKHVYVITDNDMNEPIETVPSRPLSIQSTPSIPLPMNSKISSVFVPKTEEKSDKETDINSLVNMLLALNRRNKPLTEYSADMPATLGNTDIDVTSELFNTDKFLNEIIGKPKMAFNSIPMNLMGGTNKTQGTIHGSRRMNLYTDFEDLMGGWDAESKTSDRSGNETSDEHTTLKQTYRRNNSSTAIRDNEKDMKDYSKISRTPGKKRRKSKSKSKPKSKSKSKSKSKQKRTESDEGLDYDYDESKDNNQGDENRALSRQIKSQVDQIHERTVEKIKAIMNVDTDIAKNYKAVLYRRVKEEHPNLSGYERALEMEKLATKENLDKIDINKITQEIKEHLEKKRKEREEQGQKLTSSESSETPVKKKRASKKKVVDTSSVSIASDSGLSATSE